MARAMEIIAQVADDKPHVLFCRLILQFSEQVLRSRAATTQAERDDAEMRKSILRKQMGPLIQEYHYDMLAYAPLAQAFVDDADSQKRIA